MKEIDYQKFRWFYTSSGALVIGGKSSEQNEDVIKRASNNSVVMHTEQPGSPFCVIMDDNPTEKDLKEMAIFCACLSKAWKNKKKSVDVHSFSGSQVYKTKGMNTGTFGVEGRLNHFRVDLKLYLTFQNEKIRCVPFKTDIAFIVPGKKKKEEVAMEIAEKLNIKKEEALSALPSDNINIEWF
ncbi:MAG: DUF814 domain-containing protein [Nanoarchaeota archaeon]|nr:DUF814 domain-containing protein [Nanoarchaeota archaeon]